MCGSIVDRICILCKSGAVRAALLVIGSTSGVVKETDYCRAWIAKLRQDLPATDTVAQGLARGETGSSKREDWNDELQKLGIRVAIVHMTYLQSSSAQAFWIKDIQYLRTNEGTFDRIDAVIKAEPPGFAKRLEQVARVALEKKMSKYNGPLHQLDLLVYVHEDECLPTTIRALEDYCFLTTRCPKF